MVIARTVAYLLAVPWSLLEALTSRPDPWVEAGPDQVSVVPRSGLIWVPPDRTETRWTRLAGSWLNR